MPYRYLPVLRTKAAEIPALANLSNSAKTRTFPLFRMTEKVSATVQSSIITKLQNFPFSLDGSYNFDVTGSTNGFISLFNTLGGGGLPIIPAVSTNDDQVYITAALGLIGKFEEGLVVISTLDDASSSEQWCLNNNLNLKDVDLIVAIGDVSNLSIATYSEYIKNEICKSIMGQKFKSVSLHSFSAAKDHSGYNRGRSLVPRKCWKLWNNVVGYEIPFKLNYSDCGHIHFSLEEPPGYAMANATVSVRYTIDDNWVVIKGSPTRGASGSPMGAQYRSHAKALTKELEFNQIPGCWGDGKIQDYATSSGSAGGRQQWVEILLNRHISHVCERLP